MRPHITHLSSRMRLVNWAEEKRHHPDIHFKWSEISIDMLTHKVDGLHKSNFVMAARMDRIHEEYKPEYSHQFASRRTTPSGLCQDSLIQDLPVLAVHIVLAGARRAPEVVVRGAPARVVVGTAVAPLLSLCLDADTPHR